MEYRVSTFRDAGLEAKWSRTRKGAPIIVVRNPEASSPHQRNQWWVVDNSMWKAMQSEGVADGFDQATLLGSLFSVPA